MKNIILPLKSCYASDNKITSLRAGKPILYGFSKAATIIFTLLIFFLCFSFNAIAQKDTLTPSMYDSDTSCTKHVIVEREVDRETCCSRITIHIPNCDDV